MYDFSIERPKAVTYRATIDPAAPATIEGSVDCTKGKRSVERDFSLSISGPLTAKAPLTIPNPESCFVDVSLSYDDFGQDGSLKLELFSKKRKRR